MPHGHQSVQYLSIRYTKRLADTGAVTSVGSRGDAYNNALAETVNGLSKTEIIRKGGPPKTLAEVDLATMDYWFNERWLLEPLNHLPPAEFEDLYYPQLSLAKCERLTQLSLQ